jgi:CHAT domain/AAA ATPase domain
MEEPSMSVRYDDFALRLGRDAGGEWTAQILHAPGGGGSHSFSLPWRGEQRDALLRQLEHQVRGGGAGTTIPQRQVRMAEVPPPATCSPAEFGADLFSALFSGRVRDSFVASLARAAARSDVGLRLRLVFDPDEEGIAALAGLPWELLFDSGPRDFLSRSSLTPLVRFLDVPRSTEPRPVKPPLSILVAGASPEGLAPLSLEREAKKLEEVWGRQLGIRLELLADATLQATYDRLRGGAFQILHFMGHGDFSERDGSGCLLFEDDAHQPVAVEGPVLAEALKSIPSLHLVVLNACETATLPRREGVDPYSGVASALVLGGIPGVVAMQFPISDRAAIAFSSGLYRALAAGEPVEAAVAAGRVAIFLEDSKSMEWATPALYSRTAPGGLLDGLVSDTPPAPAVVAQIRDMSGLIEQKTRGFVGREFVFTAVEQFTDSSPSGYFLLTGAPGIGKSAIVSELARRHGWVHHFNVRSANVIRPEAFLANTCAQLITRHRLPYGSLPPEAERDSGFLLTLLEQVSRRLGPGERCVFLVDALDESDRDGLPVGVNPLYLPPVLPAGVFAVLTSRPLDTAASPHFDGEQQALALSQGSAANLADARRYVETYLGRRGVDAYRAAQGLGEGEFADFLTRKSEGNFMYLHYVLRGIESGQYDERPLGEIPAGLRSYYEGHWRLMRGRDPVEVWIHRKVPVLAALMATKQPIPFDLIVRFANISEPQYVREVLREWRPFLDVDDIETPAGARVHLYSLYHESFHDFLAHQDDMAESRGLFTAEEEQILASAGVRLSDALEEDDFDE